LRGIGSTFHDDQLDLGLLLWDMHRSVPPDAFPPGRISLQFDFSDQPKAKRTLWLVCEAGDVDICPKDPGFEVSLYVVTDLRTLTRVWMADIPVRTAITSGGIELSGSREIRQRFERWLAGIQDSRPPAGDIANAAQSERRSVHRVI
jgi:hypothetical protein